MIFTIQRAARQFRFLVQFRCCLAGIRTGGPSHNPSETILPTIITEGAKLGTAALFKAAGSTAGVQPTGLASLIRTLYGTLLDAQAKDMCRNVTAFSSSW